MYSWESMDRAEIKGRESSRMCEMRSENHKSVDKFVARKKFVEIC